MNKTAQKFTKKCTKKDCSLGEIVHSHKGNTLQFPNSVEFASLDLPLDTICWQCRYLTDPTITPNPHLCEKHAGSLSVSQSKKGRTKKWVFNAVKDILWMARRYADKRRTYAPSMFNDAYDVLREEFGDVIDENTAEDMAGNVYFDISIETSTEHPYAIYGDNMKAEDNIHLKNRPFYKKPKKR